MKDAQGTRLTMEEADERIRVNLPPLEDRLEQLRVLLIECRDIAKFLPMPTSHSILGHIDVADSSRRMAQHLADMLPDAPVA